MSAAARPSRSISASRWCHSSHPSGATDARRNALADRVRPTAGRGRGAAVPPGLRRPARRSWRAAAAGRQLPATRALAAGAGRVAQHRRRRLRAAAGRGLPGGRVGSGTYVARTLPEELLHAAGGPPGPAAARAARPLSRRGERMARPRLLGLRGEPACRSGPACRRSTPSRSTLWARLVARRWRRPPREPARLRRPGRLPAAARGDRRPPRDGAGGPLHGRTRCIVVTGTQQALDLAARLLLDPGDAAWIEDPGYLGARGALVGARGRGWCRCRWTRDGLDVAAGVRRRPDARLAYVTPSHQYPLGVTMSLPRRLALLDWARPADAWVLEDDYDSEFRYAGRPLAALQGLDRDGRVDLPRHVQQGAVPVAAPGLPGRAAGPGRRLRRGPGAAGPPRLRRWRRRCSPTSSPRATSPATSGGCGRCTPSGRRRWCERRGASWAAWLEVRPTRRRPAPGRLAAGRAWTTGDVSGGPPAAGVEAPPLSAYRLEPGGRGGLLLGYAGYDAAADPRRRCGGWGRCCSDARAGRPLSPLSPASGERGRG